MPRVKKNESKSQPKDNEPVIRKGPGRPRKLPVTPKAKVFNTSRLDKHILADMIKAQPNIHPSCGPWTVDNHFIALKKYAKEVPAEYYFNILLGKNDKLGDVETYRQFYLSEMNLQGTELPTTLYGSFDRWLYRKYDDLKKNNFVADTVKAHQYDHNRFLFFTVTYLVKCYHKKCEGAGGIDTRERKRILGSDFVNIYTEAKNHYPDLLRQQLVGSLDEADVELSDDEGGRSYTGHNTKEDEESTGCNRDNFLSDDDETSDIGEGETSLTFSKKIANAQRDIDKWGKDIAAFKNKAKALKSKVKRMENRTEMWTKKELMCQKKQNLWKSCKHTKEETISKLANVSSLDDLQDDHFQVQEALKVLNFGNNRSAALIPFLIENSRFNVGELQEKFSLSQDIMRQGSSKSIVNPGNEKASSGQIENAEEVLSDYDPDTVEKIRKRKKKNSKRKFVEIEGSDSEQMAEKSLKVDEKKDKRVKKKKLTLEDYRLRTKESVIDSGLSDKIGHRIEKPLSMPSELLENTNVNKKHFANAKGPQLSDATPSDEDEQVLGIEKDVEKYTRPAKTSTFEIQSESDKLGPKTDEDDEDSSIDLDGNTADFSDDEIGDLKKSSDILGGAEEELHTDSDLENPEVVTLNDEPEEPDEPAQSVDLMNDDITEKEAANDDIEPGSQESQDIAKKKSDVFSSFKMPKKI